MSKKYSEGDNQNQNRTNNNGWENKTSGKTLSPWLVDIPQPLRFQKLDRSLMLVIVGGGVAGLSTAYLLQDKRLP